MTGRDMTALLLEQVQKATAHNMPVTIEGQGSKRFYGHTAAENTACLQISGHSGVIEYEPGELVIRVRAGTPLADVNQLLSSNRQMLAFEPPDFENRSTMGGVIASGLSGPRRPYAGSARDFVLGVRMITGHGEVLEFGGQVMKNVAGYDVSRLVTGSLGTLGLILDVSLKVLPEPEAEVTLGLPIARQELQSRLRSMQDMFPLSAAAHQDGVLYLRLSGSEAAIQSARQKTGGEETDSGFWQKLNTLACFSSAKELWRISVAPASQIFLKEAEVIDWGGGLRWLVDPGFDPREQLAGEDGHATLVKYAEAKLPAGVELFHPLPPHVLNLHQRLKQQFDPAGVFNPGRMYRAF